MPHRAANVSILAAQSATAAPRSVPDALGADASKVFYESNVRQLSVFAPQRTAQHSAAEHSTAQHSTA